MKSGNLKLLVAAMFAVASMASHAADPTSGEITLTGWFDSDSSGTFSLTAGVNPGQELYKSFTSYINGTLWLNFSSSGGGTVGVYQSIPGTYDYDHNLLGGPMLGNPFTAGVHSYSFSVTDTAPNNSYAVYLKNTGSSPLTFSTMGVGSVAAVPEPETYAMLLAGLGVLGFTGRRRMKQG